MSRHVTARRGTAVSRMDSVSRVRAFARSRMKRWRSDTRDRDLRVTQKCYTAMTAVLRCQVCMSAVEACFCGGTTRQKLRHEEILTVAVHHTFRSVCVGSRQRFHSAISIAASVCAQFVQIERLRESNVRSAMTRPTRRFRSRLTVQEASQRGREKSKADENRRRKATRLKRAHRRGAQSQSGYRNALSNHLGASPNAQSGTRCPARREHVIARGRCLFRSSG